MKRPGDRIAIFLALALFACAVSFAKPEDSGVAIFGTWKITAVLDSADVSGMSERQAKTLLGKPVRIGRDRFEFNGTTCKSPSYERTVEDAAQHLREKGHIGSAKLHLPNPVAVIDAKCTFIYLKRTDRIVMGWDGVYFEAARQRK